MKRRNSRQMVYGALALLVSAACGAQIEPVWESLAASYQMPDWFVDSKFGVWFQWGVPSSVKDGQIYAFLLAPPTEDILIETLAKGGIFEAEIAWISMFGSNERIKWTRAADSLTIQLPKTLPDLHVIGFRIEMNWRHRKSHEILHYYTIRSCSVHCCC